jgi:hypothetical protein
MEVALDMLNYYGVLWRGPCCTLTYIASELEPPFVLSQKTIVLPAPRFVIQLVRSVGLQGRQRGNEQEACKRIPPNWREVFDNQSTQIVSSPTSGQVQTMSEAVRRVSNVLQGMEGRVGRKRGDSGAPSTASTTMRVIRAGPCLNAVYG